MIRQSSEKKNKIIRFLISKTDNKVSRVFKLVFEEQSFKNVFDNLSKLLFLLKSCNFS